MADPFTVIEGACVEAARARGWLSLGENERAEAALDRAMVALTVVEDDCPEWARPVLERTHAELARLAV